MSERGLSKELEAYAAAQIEEARTKNTELHDDLNRYRENAARAKVWADVKNKLGELRKKYLREEDDDL